MSSIWWAEPTLRLIHSEKAGMGMRTFCYPVLLSMLLLVSDWGVFATEEFEPADGKII